MKNCKKEISLLLVLSMLLTLLPVQALAAAYPEAGEDAELGSTEGGVTPYADGDVTYTINADTNTVITVDASGVLTKCRPGTATKIEIPASIPLNPEDPEAEMRDVTVIGSNAFSGCKDLTSINIPDSVTSIGNSAFSSCKGLTSITIPNSVTSIGIFAFLDCSGLTSVNIPDGITCVAESAFRSCSGLTSVTIPDNVTSIESMAFAYCSNLTSVTIPDSVTSIGSNAFSSCNALTSITIPDGVTSIGSSSFNSCSSLTSVTIPDSVTSIGTNAFSYCSSLTDITIPDGITSIENGVFQDCGKLTSIVIPDGVTTIGARSFFNCGSMTSVTIPDSVTSIGGSAFEGCKGLTSITIPSSVTSIENYAFKDCSSLTSITIPSSVTSIAEGMFKNCTGLTSATIPDSVTSIGNYAFEGCKSLASITIPDSVTSIGWSVFSGCISLTSAGSIGGDYNLQFGWTEKIPSNAFHSCTSLTSITIPDSVTSIESSAFSNCSGLTSVTIPDSVTSIGSSAFSNCSGLTSVTIPDSVTSIGGLAFYSCTGLTSITIPDSVTSIGSGVLNGCTGLISFTIPNSVTSVEKHMFSGCSSLTSITIPSSVTSIGDYAFSYCSNLTSITIPDSVTSIGSYAFFVCKNLVSLDIPDSVTSIGNRAFSACTKLEHLRLSSGLQTVTSIDRSGAGTRRLASLFSECPNLKTAGPGPEYNIELGQMSSIPDYLFDFQRVDYPTSDATYNVDQNYIETVVIPDSVTSIGKYAFRRCHNLKSVEIPNGVATIAQGAFYACGGITSIEVPNSVRTIGKDAFAYCSGLTSVTIPDSVLSIGSNAFQGCRSLTSAGPIGGNFDFEFGWTRKIPNNAFSQCTGLTSVTIPNGITDIGASAFDHCSGLTSITIPDSVTGIGSNAFYYCSGLTGITIPDSVTSWGERIFSGCSGLTSVTIPNGVTSIWDYMFSSCSGLISVTIPAGITSIWDYAFANCSSLTSVDIPDSVTSIGKRVFYNCTGLTNITIPDGVTSIEDSVFSGCSGLTSVTIPDSVSSIGNYAFYGCSSLTSITIPDCVINIGNNVFSGVNPDFVLYCYPDSYAETYAKNKNINYQLILRPGRTLSVSVLGENGDALSEGFTVTWYNADGTEAGTGPQLSGADKKKSYSFTVTLGDDLAAVYEQPKQQTIAPADGAKCSVQLVKKAVAKTLTLSGWVKNQDGKPIQDAAVSITPADGDPVETVTGSDGGFSAVVPYAVLSITVRRDGYYSKREILDLTDKTGDTHDAGTYTLTPVQVITDRVTLSITQRRAAENPDAAMDVPLNSLGSMVVSVAGKASTDFEVQGLTLIFNPNTVQAGEKITVTVTDPSGAYCADSTEVVLDANRLGSAELTMVQKGSLVLGGVSGPSGNLLLFDSSGNCILTRAAEPGLSSGTLEAGKYRLVLIQKSELLRGVSRLDYLGTFGLNAGSDYLLEEVSIADGQITRLPDCVVPALDEGRISYTVAEHTGVTTSKPGGVVAGELLMVRTTYALDESKGVAVNSLRIVLPEGVILPEGTSAMIDGQAAPYSYDAVSHEVTVAVAGRSKAAVWLCCTPTKGGSYSISAYLALSNGVSQPIGAAVVRAENAKLEVLERTGKAEGLTASGKTMPGYKVKLYDNDEYVGETTANAVGSWSMNFDLVQPVYSYSYHNIYAVMESENLSDSVTTESALVTYDKRLDIEVKRITMYNTGDHGAQETVFDFTNNTATTTPYYRIWPSRYPTFTFKAEFSGNASNLSEVYVVTTNSAGDKTYVKTKYDAASGAWVGTHNYTSFNNAPVAVGAAYKFSSTGQDLVSFDVEAYVDLVLDVSQKQLSAGIKNKIEQSYHINEDQLIINLDEDTGTCTISAPFTYTDDDGATSEAGSYTLTIDKLPPEQCTPEALKDTGYIPVDEGETVWEQPPSGNPGSGDIGNGGNKTTTVSLPDGTRYTEAVTGNGNNDYNTDLQDFLSGLGTSVGLILPGTYGVAASIGKDLVEYYGDERILYMILDGNVECLEIRSDGFDMILRSCPNAASLIPKWIELQDAVKKYRSEGLNKIRLTLLTNLMGRASQYALIPLGNKMGEAARSQLPTQWQKKLNNFETKVIKAKQDAQSVKQLPEQLRLELKALVNQIGPDLPGNIATELIQKWADKVGTKVLDIARFLAISAQARSYLNSEYVRLNRLYDELQAQVIDICKKGSSDGGNDTGLSDITGSHAPPCRPVTPIADPSGYVYEAVPSNRIEDVTAVISEKNGGDWNASDYDQNNPQRTASDGGYYWDVPQGNWKVSFTKAGYTPTDTEAVAKAAGYSDGWLPVPPPQLEINVGMVSTAAPSVQQAAVYTERAEVAFSQYMDIESVKTALSLTQDGALLSGCTVEPLNAEYNLEKTTQYATRFAIAPSGGELSGDITVTVDGTAKNYAGTPMTGAYTSPVMTVSIRPTAIAALDTVSVILRESTGVPVTLQPGLAGRKLRVESLSPALVEVSLTEVTTGADGEAEITLTGTLPGSGLIRVSDPASGLSKTVTVNVGAVKEVPPVVTVKPVTATLEDGTAVTSGMTVHSGAKITLCTQTAGAEIRYTLDDTCPCTEAALTYRGPIVITDATVLRAAACKDGTYSATIRLELRLESTPPEHTHTWAEAWTHNTTHHWHECNTEGCTVTENSGKDSYGAHVYDSDADTTCNSCGYVREVTPPTPEHTHTWAETWSHSATHHWHECKAEGCPVAENSGKGSYGAHTSDSGKVTTAATATTEGVKTYSCTVCGYVLRTESIPATGGSAGGGPSSGGGSASGKNYSISTPTGVTGGTVRISPGSAGRGDTVTITATPDSGYRLEKLTVTDGKNNELKLTGQGGGKYTFTMPAGAVKVEAVFASQGPEQTPWTNPYSDVEENAWYYDAVQYVCEGGLMNGYGNGLFGVHDNLSRAQLVQILYNKEGRPAAADRSSFTDVEANAWYAPAVNWAAERTIAGGYGGGLFGPNDNITREQLAVILWRYAGSPAAGKKELHFTDADAVSSYALEALCWAVENGILSGKGGGVLDPLGLATRAQAAQMLKNYLKR